jgi:PKD repeat protein/Tol biopolymer transport system component
MKISKTFGIIVGIFSAGIFSLTSFSQNKINAYQVEQDGYFTTPLITSAGTLFTDNTANKIYLVQNNKVSVIANTPGCGRYYKLSPDKSRIGYKKINPDGMQVPAILDLTTFETTELSEPVDLCGQVSFTSDGKIAFTLGNELFVINNGSVVKYTLGNYSNIAPISPDGNYVVYNDNNDQLFLLDLLSNNTTKITDDNFGYAYPQWSPDGSKIAYSSLPGELKVYDITSGNTFSLGAGSHFSWSENSQFLVYDVVNSENMEFKGSEIYMASYTGNNIFPITSSSDINEMYPVLSGNTILFSTYEGRSMISSELNMDSQTLRITDTLFTSSQVLNLFKGFSDNFMAKADTVFIPGVVPYVHQVYDTPDWHYGYGSCAPTTAIMALGYFNVLPYWNITCSSPSTHTSHYGAYVAELYRHNEVYYNTSDVDGGGSTTYGGYGYMWGLGSPSGYMDEYLSNHGITSVHSSATTYQNMVDEIDAGYPFPLCNTLSTSGHLTLTLGYFVGQHTLVFNDPYGDKNDGSWPNYYGKHACYDWPGYNNGFENLNSMAWTASSEGSEPVYNDTIIDDVYYNHGFYMYNQGVALMRYYRDTKTGGYNGHSWYTYTTASTTVDTCYVTWTPNLPAEGDYEVSAYIPTTNASATTARYKVYYDGGNQTVIVNQAPVYGDWVSLGTFHFLAGSSGYVRLGDASGVQSEKVAFDAMKWVNVTQPAAVASFNASSTAVCEGNSVTYTNTSTNATSYVWSFEGGSPASSTQTNPSVTYFSSGNFDVELISVGSGGNDTLTMTNYITVNSPATANFTASDTVYLPSPLFSFTNASSNATSYSWDFGDGGTSTSQNPSHTYSTAGNFTVTLIAFSSCGNDTITFVVHILNPPPVAAFSASLTTICAGDTILFSSSSTNSTSYNWSFSGGSPATSTLQNPIVTYANAGTYDAQLIVVGLGGSDTLSLQNYISVNPLADAQFSANSTHVYLPAANVIFTNSSTNATSYHWDFGDGSSSTDQNPWNGYTTTGFYTVTLIAYNSQCGNDTLVLTDYIQVDIATGIEEENETVSGFTISPNPTNNYFTISYELKTQGRVEIKIFDMIGKEIGVVQSADQDAGKYSVAVNNEAANLSKGVYLIKLTCDDIQLKEKILIQQ